MKADVIITTYCEKKVGFLFEDQNLTEARFFSDYSMIGSICTAVVTKIVPNMGAAFLAGPDGMVLFYQLKENSGRHLILRNRNDRKEEIRPGDTLLVQISADAQKGKQAEATSKLSVGGSCVVVNRTGQIGFSKKIRDGERKEELRGLFEEILQDPSYAGLGVIARTSAERESDETIREVTVKLLCELKELITSSETVPEYKWVYQKTETPEDYIRHLTGQGIYESVTVHTDLPWESPGGKTGRTPRVEECDGYFLHRLTEGMESPLLIFRIPTLIEEACQRKIYIKDGGYLYIEHTEAMTVIDVNSGKNIHGKEHEAGALALNLQAADVIARQIRLRNLSGMIMIDFISMKSSEHKKEVLSRLRANTKNDPCHVMVVDITKLGIVEMTREKKDPPLIEQIRKNHENT